MSKSQAGRPTPRPRTGFSLVELLVVVLIIALLIGILIPTLGAVRERAQRAKDTTQLRNIVQGLEVWAGNHDGDYPLPSRLDRDDATVATSEAYQKDNSGNILSVMIWNDIIPPEALVNPAESSVRIGVDEGYQFETPEKAVDPSRAVFDPGFAGVPLESGTATGTGGRRLGEGGEIVGGTSYATVIPFGPRQGQWRSSGGKARPVVADRGPEYMGVAGNWSLRSGATGTGSNTLRIFGLSGRWRGNVAWTDGRVEFFTRPDPSPQMTRTFPNAAGGGAGLSDNIFVNENDDNGFLSMEQNPGQNDNTFLRPFSDVQAGGPSRRDARVTTFID